MNPRISPKERGLLKGAIRRVFSRSDLRRKAMERQIIEHSDPKRPRVKKWAWCAICGEVTPAYTMAVDHIDPIVPVNTALEHMKWDDLIDNTWCDENKLQLLCPMCHNSKTKSENAERRKLKQENKNNGSPSKRKTS